MLYEEKCQLGFSSPSQNDLFYFGQDDSHNDYQQHLKQLTNSDIYSHYRHDNYNKENTQVNDQQEELKTLISNAALKLNFKKKVKLGEQLSFKLENAPLFSNEEPMPIEFRNNQKQGIPKQIKKGKKSKKSSKKGNFFMPDYLKKRPGSAKPKPVKESSGWNEDNRAQKYFDVNIDIKAKREFEKQQRQQARVQTQAAVGAPVVNKNFEEGKFEIGFMKTNGQVGSKFEVYNNIDTLAQENQKVNYAATGYSLKNMLKPPVSKKLVSSLSPQKKRSASPNKSYHKDIHIAQQSHAYDDQEQMFKQLRHPINSESSQIESHSYLKANNEIDMKLHNLVGQTLQQKEVVIKALEDQLEQERLRREQMSQQFQNQISEFEQDKQAVERIRKVSNVMERQNHKEDDLDMAPSKETHRTTQRSKKAPTTYRSERVKTTIPKAAQALHTKAMTKPTKYIEELKKQEIDRAVKMQHEEEIAQEVIKKLRDNPNEHLNELQTEVVMLNNKIEPLLRRVEQAARNIQVAKGPSMNRAKGPLGMLSRMGGRLINFYADDLVELLLNDFLAETALELQNLEKNQLKDYSGEEAKFLAQNLLKTIVDYQSEEQFVEMRWNNPAAKSKIPKMISFQGLAQGDPQPIAFNLNDDLDEVKLPHEKQLQQKSTYQNPFSKVDAFSQKLAEISMSAPDVSYNMMSKIEEGKTLSHPIEIKGEKDAKYEIKRKYKIDIDPETLTSITLYREKFEKYLKMHNNTANRDVWKIYDHIAADIFHELFNQSLKNVSADMEDYIEKVIYDEFQM